MQRNRQKRTARSEADSLTELVSEAVRLLALDPPPALSAHLRPGDVLGDRFRVLQELGSGATSSVFLAEDRHLGKVALKIIEPAGGPPALDRVIAEVKSARSVRHPNVCPVFDLFMFHHQRCGPIAGFSMKYLAGEALESRLLRGPYCPGEALDIARGIASGLDALHAEGIVHGDLKPGNIMLIPSPRGTATPVIVDFGLSTSLSGATAKSLSGSPHYMAPEQFRSGDVSAASDIYAFGLILYEMLAGARPFPSEDLIPAAIRRAVEDPPRLGSVAPFVPRALEQAIACSLSRTPRERPRSAGEMVDMMTGDRMMALPIPGTVRFRPLCHHTPTRRRVLRRSVA